MQELFQHKGYRIYKTADGMHEAWKASGHEEKFRPVENGVPQVWNGSDVKRIVLPTTNEIEACDLLDQALKKRVVTKRGDDPSQLRIE